MTERVTVVIPTRNRPHLVVRAVRSALAQTQKVYEVVVVVDGEDKATVDALKEIGDPRLRWIMLPESHGSNNARNVGALSSKSEWIAFLDDDDEWLPNKIERQLAASKGFDIVSCRFFAKSTKGTLIWPKLLPAEGQAFGNYLFARRSIFNGEAAIITSTLMARRTVFYTMPFSTTLRRHQDADWVIRATSDGARMTYMPDALVKFDDEIGRKRISTSYNWRESLEWIESIRNLVGKRAFAGFILTSVGAAAAEKREWQAFLRLICEAFCRGRPTALHLALYLGMWLFPQRTRQHLRAAAHSLRLRRPTVLVNRESHT